MTITAASADALEALALAIFNPNLQPNASPASGSHYDPAFFTGIKGQDSAIDAQLASLIAPVMLAIDGLTLETGFMYTIGSTCATKLRPKHWFIQGLYEFVPGPLPPCSVGFMYYPLPGEAGSTGDVGGYGFTLGATLCAGICNTWAHIIRLWLAGSYPRAAPQPSA